MLNPSVCKKCMYGKISEPTYDDFGNHITLWSVECDIEDMTQVLLADDLCPDGCPYCIEHLLSVTDMTREDVLCISGENDEKRIG